MRHRFYTYSFILISFVISCKDRRPVIVLNRDTLGHYLSDQPTLANPSRDVGKQQCFKISEEVTREKIDDISFPLTWFHLECPKIVNQATTGWILAKPKITQSGFAFKKILNMKALVNDVYEYHSITKYPFGDYGAGSWESEATFSVDTELSHIVIGAGYEKWGLNILYISQWRSGFVFVLIENEQRHTPYLLYVKQAPDALFLEVPNNRPILSAGSNYSGNYYPGRFTTTGPF